jgi:hypothetical protein
MTRSVNGRQRALRCYHELTRFFVYHIPDAPEIRVKHANLGRLSTFESR